MERAAVLEGWVERSACKELRRGRGHLRAVGAWLGETHCTRWQAGGTAAAFLRRARPARVRGRAAEGRGGEPKMMLRGKDAVCRREKGRPPNAGRTRSSEGGGTARRGPRGQGGAGWRGEEVPPPGGLARGELPVSRNSRSGSRESGKGPERWLWRSGPWSPRENRHLSGQPWRIFSLALL